MRLLRWLRLLARAAAAGWLLLERLARQLLAARPSAGLVRPGDLPNPLASTSVSSRSKHPPLP
eukprot:937478-Lingulodinium_polyedra.AAC.1